MKFYFIRFFFFALLLIAWHVITLLKFWPEYILPSPMSVANAFLLGITEGDYIAAILSSFKRLSIGYTLSMIIGILLGLILATSKLFDKTFGSLIFGLQALPSICWLPIAFIWFGLNDAAIIFVVVAGSMPSMATATQTSINHIPEVWIRAGKNMGAGGYKLYWHVLIPAAFPTLLEGLRQGWTFSWRSLMGGELLFFTLGLGQLLNMGRELNDMSQVMAVMLLIVIIGLITDVLLFSTIEKRFSKRWGFKI